MGVMFLSEAQLVWLGHCHMLKYRPKLNSTGLKLKVAEALLYKAWLEAGSE